MKKRIKMREFIKKHLGVPENWDKHDFEIQRYSFNDIEDVLLAYRKKKTLKQLIFDNLNKQGLRVESDRFNDNSSNWLEIKSLHQDLPKETSIVITFSKNGKNIKEMDIYESPIEVVDEKQERIFSIKKR